jgi:hypothetical protein
MPLVILHHLLNVFVQLANKRGYNIYKKKNALDKNVVVSFTLRTTICIHVVHIRLGK